MQKLAAHGVADITLTGGEAKLIKGFKELVVVASSLFTNVNVFSNGLNWRDEEVELLSHLGNVSVQISIDGMDNTHDQLRGRKGGFKESMNTIKKLSEANIPVIVAMTLMSPMLMKYQMWWSNVPMRVLLSFVQEKRYLLDVRQKALRLWILILKKWFKYSLGKHVINGEIA